MNRTRTIAITGGNGFIGRALVDHFASNAWSVISFERRHDRLEEGHITRLPFDLARAGMADLSAIEVLIHAAYQPIIGKNTEQNVNIDAARLLAENARRIGTKVIFLSTLSAHDNAESIYGKTKLRMEKFFDQEHNLVLRLGLVLGAGGGLYGKIAQTIKKMPFIPLLGGDKQIQTIASDDLCRLIMSGIERNISGTYNIAHPEVITIKELYAAIAEAGHRTPVFFSTPIVPIYYVLLLIERLHVKLPFTSENVLGLKCLRAFDTANDVARFGVALKNYREALGLRASVDGKGTD